MRFRMFLCLLALAVALCGCAAAETVTYGDVTYVFPSEDASVSAYTLSANGYGFDAVTMEAIETSALPGAVFGVYMQNADGGYIPFTDPSNPLQPLTFTTENAPITFTLPRSLPLFLHQESAPEGYLPDPDAPSYLPLAAPTDIRIAQYQQGMQGLRLTLLTESGTPLPGAAFTLENETGSYTLVTDAAGSASQLGIAPGTYQLRQETMPEGFGAETPELEITIPEHSPLQLTLQNSRNGSLLLRPLGVALDAARTPRLLPIDRDYQVYSVQDALLGTLQAGQSLSLPADQEGTAYRLRAADAPKDGFSPDEAVHTVTIYPGETALFQPVMQSSSGYFSLVHQSPDGQIISGGTFALYDAEGQEVLSFSAGANGAYAPDAPLPAGAYTLRLKTAAADTLYTENSIPFVIEPFISNEAGTQVLFTSERIPEGLLRPTVTVETQQLPSLADADAAIHFTLQTNTGTDWLLEGLEYQFDLPTLDGLVDITQRDDGASFRLPKRYALEGVALPSALTISGTVSYAFHYPVDDTGSRQTKNIARRFTVEVATFKSPVHAEYALAGHVTDENGEPIANIDVSLTDASGDTRYETVQTDIYGAYAFVNAPEGSVLAFDTQQGYGVKMVDGDAHILPLRTVTGQVETHGGIEGYPITLQLGDEETTPDAKGQFTLTGLFENADRLNVQTQDDLLTEVTMTGDSAVVQLIAPAQASGSVLDPAGLPIEAVTIAISDGVRHASAVTDASGQFAIGGLYPGQYVLTASMPEGYQLLGDATQAVSLQAGEAKETGGFMGMKPASIAGTLLEDTTPYAGITLRLMPGGFETITDENGRFAFDGLLLGDYTLEAGLPEEAIMLDMPEVFTITQSGETLTHTLHAVRPASISGRIWQDANDDGLLTYDEVGQPDVALALLDADENTIDTTVTSGDGQFSFEGLLPGTYRIAITLPEGMIFAREAPDTQRLAAGVDSHEAVSPEYVLSSGERLQGLMAGAVSTGSLDVVIWEDTDGNGLLDWMEPRLSGTKVTVTRPEGSQDILTTNDNGMASLAGLRPADYVLHIALPEDGVFTRQADAASDAVASVIPMSDAQTAEYTVSLRRWRMEATVPIGVQKTGSLSASVWLDADASGKAIAAEGYAGLSVALLNASGRVIAEETTGTDGTIAFARLRPGPYSLRYTLPEDGDWGFTTAMQQTGTGWGDGQQVDLGSGESLSLDPVGITRLGRIEGTAFEDANYNGLRDADEGFLALTVSLLDENGDVLQQKSTDASGAYRFTGLPSGIYRIQFTLPEGLAFTLNRNDAPSFNSDVAQTAENAAQTDAVFLPMGETLLLDAGAYRKCSISGLLWHDVQNIGLYTDENPPLLGFDIELLQDGEPHAVATADLSGRFRFADLAPGTYTLRVALPEGMRFSIPGQSSRASQIAATDESTAETQPITLKNGENRGNIDIGAVYTATLSGKALNIKEDKGLAGVTVSVVRNGETIAQTVTGDDGRYQLDALRPGRAELHFAPPEGWTWSTAETSSARAITIAQQGTYVDEDMSFLPESTITGKMWLDADANGEQNGLEAPLSGTRVTLLWHDGLNTVTQATMQTDSAGMFHFDKLLPGTYTLQYEAQKDIYYYQGAETKPFTLDMGVTESFDVPAHLGASVSGLVFEDSNVSGVHDRGEAGLSGVTVQLLGHAGQVLQQTETDSIGAYLFQGVPPTECRVRFTLPEGFLFTDEAEGGSRVPPTDTQVGATLGFKVSMGDAITHMDAGVIRHTRIGDLVWLDANGNGLQDTNETGVEGITVQLLRPLENGEAEVIKETRTDHNGRYRFDGVRPGTYQVSFEAGSNYIPTKQMPDLDEINSKVPWIAADVLTTEPFAVPSGVHLLNIDAGLVRRQNAAGLGWVIDADRKIH